jgi:hypothetical protein
VKTLTIQPDPNDINKSLPYPFHVNEEGLISQQDLWKGSVYRVIGFQDVLERHRIDLHWSDAWAEPEKTIGKYVVTSDEHGKWAVHEAPIGRFDRRD